MSMFTPINVLKTIEVVYNLLNQKFSQFSLFNNNKKVNFEDKFLFVKTFSQENIQKFISQNSVQQRIFLAKVLEDIMKEIDSIYYVKYYVNFQTDIVEAFTEFQNQLKNVYIRYNEEENRVLLHYSPIPTYSKDWNNLTRYSRGIVVDMDTYTYVVHPYDKFFNYMENNETKHENLPDLSYEIAVKLDGSEGILYPTKHGSVRIITKGGFETEQGIYATRLLWSKYTKQAVEITNTRLYKDFTLTFEILYAKDDPNRIVVAYDEPDLRLIGVRDLRTGKTLSYSEVISFANKLGFPATELEKFTLDELMKLRKDRENFEGWVIRFENELYMKIKCESYLDAHGARFGTSLKGVFNLIKDGKWDDFIASIAEENRAVPEALRKKLVNFATHYMRNIFDVYESMPYIEAQKDFGLYVQKNVEQTIRGYMFSIRAGKEVDVFEQPWSRFKLLYEAWEAQQVNQ